MIKLLLMGFALATVPWLLYLKAFMTGELNDNKQPVQKKDAMTKPTEETTAEQTNQTKTEPLKKTMTEPVNEKIIKRLKETMAEQINESTRPENKSATKPIKEVQKTKMEYTREIFLKEAEEKCLRVTADTSDNKKNKFFEEIFLQFSEDELKNVIDFINEYSGITLYMKTDVQTHLKTIEINPLCDVKFIYDNKPAVCVAEIYDTFCVHNHYYMTAWGEFFKINNDDDEMEIADDPRGFFDYLIRCDNYNQDEIEDQSREKYNKNDPEAVEIRRKVDMLHSRYSKIVLNDVISIEEVENYELVNNVKLPDDYVWFITNVGDGGTWDTSTGYPICSLCNTFFSDEAVRGYKRRRKRYSVDVWSKGCAYSLGIIVKGEHFGEITSNGEGLAFYYPHKFNCFKELYSGWLEDALLGYNQHAFYRRISGTIEENLESFKKYNCNSLLYNILWKINPECVTEEFVCEIYSLFENEINNQNKIGLTKILKGCGYKDMYSVINQIFKPENYNDVIYYIYCLKYYEDPHDEKVDHSMKIYYPMLVEMTNFIAHNSHYDERWYSIDRYTLKRCFEMTVMNPIFKEEDIIDFLTSDDKEIIKTIAYCTHIKKLVQRVGKYIERAYAVMETNKSSDQGGK